MNWPVQILVGCPDGHDTTLRHGLAGIGNQIIECLAEMDGRAGEVQQVRLNIGFDRYSGMAGSQIRKLRRFLTISDNLLQVEDISAHDSSSGQGQQIINDCRRLQTPPARAR